MINRKRKVKVIILIICIALICVVGYLYYKKETDENKGTQTVSDTTTESNNAIETQEVTADEAVNIIEDDKVQEEISTTTEKKQNKKLPNNYEWDEKQWGEPPQIVYDFAENQEKFDLIVSEVNSLLLDGEGFTTKMSINSLYYNSEHKNIENELSNKFKQNVTHLFKNTRFYQFTKIIDGDWCMYYNQEEDVDRYIYTMRYVRGMTEEEAWDNGYMKVVGDWYFATIWMI